MDSSLIEEEDIHSESMSLYDIKHGRLELTRPPEAGIWDAATRIELMHTKLSELPPSPNCPLLRVLMLQGNAELMEVPPLFFNHMPLLHTLDLSYTSITDLPSSLFGLVELRVMYLRGCELFLELSPEIGQLKKLEELDLNETQITHVPIEMQELTNLQKLCLSFYEYDQNIGQVIPKGLISKLTRLSYLSIDVNPDHSKWDDTVQVILPEISELRFLKTLILYVPRVELLKLIPENINLDFRLVAGHHMHRIISRLPPKVEEKFKQSNRSLRFVCGNNGDGVDVLQEIRKVLGRSESFFLDRHMTIKNLSEFGLLNLYGLRACILAECNEMQTIIEKGKRPIISFLNFEVLSVFYMKNLRGIWEGVYPNHFFFGLKFLTLHTCPNLTIVFTLDFIDNLVNLEELLVQDCPKVTTLVTHKSTAFRAKYFLPKIRKISLLYLPELVNISSGLQIGPILEKIGFYYCPKLQNIFTRELVSTRLKVIKGETEWWRALRWNEAMGGQYLNDLFSPIDEQVDIMTQLVAEVDESLSSMKKKIHKSCVKQVCDHESRVEQKNYERDPKRRNTKAKVPETVSSNSTVTEPRIAFRTASEVDYLDDGYKWRKCGNSYVKGKPFPRNYYKCQARSCSARKFVERDSTDPKFITTTYQGSHDHQCTAVYGRMHNRNGPAAKTGSQIKSQNATTEEHTSSNIYLVSNDDMEHMKLYKPIINE